MPARFPRCYSSAVRTANRTPRSQARPASAGRVTLRATAAAALLLVAQVFNLPNLSTHREVHAQVVVNASADRVWQVLTDLPGYTVWNPYIYPAKGELKEGAPLELTLHNPTQTVVIEETVLSVKPGRELSWGGEMLSHNLDRTLTFSIEEVAANRVQLTAREVFQGILLPLAGGIPDDAQRGLDQMVRALRSAAELVPPHAP